MTYPFRDAQVFIATAGTPPPDPYRDVLAAGSMSNVEACTRELLALRSATRCEIAAAGCTQVATDWHHRQRRREGDDSIVNALHACRWCHRHAHNHPAQARDYGWIVSAWARPAETPVRRRGRWVLLTPDGRFDPATPPEGVFER